MISSGLTQQFTYLGLPKKYHDVGFSIKTFDDLFLLLFDLSRYNISLRSKIVCIDLSELDLEPEFLSCILEEEKVQTSKLILDLNSLIKKNDLRICFFLTKDFFLGSQLEGVSEKTIKYLNHFSLLLDCLGIDYPSLVIRVGSAYGNRKSTLKTFCKRISQLDNSVISKLIVSNDDKPSLFSTTDLLSGVYYETKIPICFRALPHYFNDGALSLREAFFLACSTWKEGTKPLFIYGESAEKDAFGFPVSSQTSGSLTTRIPTFGLNCDIVIDSVEREFCLLRYLSDVKVLPPLVLDRVKRN
jgi:UV DNA damage repair endonuclease